MMDAILAECVFHAPPLALSLTYHRHHFDPKRALMVGDNLLTDIQFGLNSGVRTLLVLGGVTKDEQVFGENASSIRPDLVMNSFGDFAVLADNLQG
jgi:4-nitrophenyl phosphatase